MDLLFLRISYSRTVCPCAPPSLNIGSMSVSVLVLMSVLGVQGISPRPEVEEDMRIPQAQGTELGEYRGERDGRGKMNGRGNMTWPDGSSYHVRQAVLGTEY